MAKVDIPYDPIRLVCDAAIAIWPSIEFCIQWAETESQVKLSIPKNELDIAVIILPTSMSVDDAKVNLVLRLAELVVGGKTEKNPEYGKCQQALLDSYNKLFDERHGTVEATPKPSNVIYMDFDKKKKAKKKVARPSV